MTVQAALLDSTVVRKEVLGRRKALHADESARLSYEACERFLSLAASVTGWNGKRVALYRAMKGELDVSHLERELLKRGAILHFPRVIDRAANELEMAEVPTGEAFPWTVGPYGISEPPEAHRAGDPARLDVIVVPGVAFGLKGERVGMGAGYYDRYLLKAPHALRLALCFDFQLYPSLHQTSHDQPVDWVVSEMREVRLERAGRWLAVNGSVSE